MRKSLFIIGVAGILGVLSFACGGGSSAEDSQASTSTKAGGSSEFAQSAPTPSGDGFLNIAADGNRILYDTDTITTTAGKEVTLTLSSEAITNAHN